MTRGQPVHDERADILGVGISPINMDDALATIAQWIEEGRSTYVCITGVHGVIESQADPYLRDIHKNAGLVTPDGMPLVWMARLFGFKRTRRVYGPDLMRALSSMSAQRGYRQFYYGGGEGIADRLQSALTKDYPGLQVAGILTPPFRSLTPDEDAAAVSEINAARPDIVWIGLSTPKQEYWMAGHRGKIDAPVMIGVGAAFDFLAGVKKQAPRWMQRSGLEWLFRLSTEPQRLWRRYFTIIPRFIVLMFLQWLRSRRLYRAGVTSS